MLLEIIRLLDVIVHAPKLQIGKWTIMALDTSAALALVPRVNALGLAAEAHLATDTATAVAAAEAAAQAAHDASTAALAAAVADSEAKAGLVPTAVEPAPAAEPVAPAGPVTTA